MASPDMVPDLESAHRLGLGDQAYFVGAGPMRELTHIAFPDFFRERTPELGLYLGIYEGGRLVAMAGERLALPGLEDVQSRTNRVDRCLDALVDVAAAKNLAFC